MDDRAPSSIHSPSLFLDGEPAGFDGFFDWHWVSSAVQRATRRNITPMDIDASVEINGHFLIFETKREGVAMQKGQVQALLNLWSRGYVTLIFLWGKQSPAQAEIYYPSGRKQRVRQNLKEAKTASGMMTRKELEKVVEQWALMADKNPCPFAYNGPQDSLAA